MKKKFGQNFLNNQEIVNKIIDAADINKNSIVYEIGPGDGIITKEIIKKNPKIFYCIEIDSSLKPRLENFFNNKNYKLIFDNALTFDEKIFLNQNVTIISNLPYNISLKLLTKWCHQQSSHGWIKEMILMFQKEVAERILATENTKKFGRITVLSSALFEVSNIINVNKINFNPAPKVHSCVLKFTSLKKPYIDKNELVKLESLSRELFSNKRKKLKKKILAIFNPETILLHKLDDLYNLRAENLPKDTIYYLAKII